MADTTEKDETEDEKVESAETGETPDEAHRAGEFDDLRDRLESLTKKLDSVYDFLVKNYSKTDESEEESDDDEPDDDEIKLIPIDELEL